MCSSTLGLGFTSLGLPNVTPFFGSVFSSRQSSLSSLIFIYGSSNWLVTSSTHDGSIETIDASTLGVSSFVKVGTFALFGFSSRKRRSILVNGAYASTFVTQGFNFGKPTNKKNKKVDIKRVMGYPVSLGWTFGSSCRQNPHDVLQGLFHGWRWGKISKP